MTSRWLTASGTEVGRRKENDDRVVVLRFKHKKRSYYAIVVCDGVGSRAGSGVCADAAATSALQGIKEYMKAGGLDDILTINGESFRTTVRVQ